MPKPFSRGPALVCSLLSCLSCSAHAVDETPFHSWLAEEETKQKAANANPQVCKDVWEGCTESPPRVNGERECRFPAAMACPWTCGLCGLIGMARNCQINAEAVSPDFRTKEVDWDAFFEGMLSRSEGGRLISDEETWIAEFPGFLSAEEVDQLVNIGTALHRLEGDDHDSESEEEENRRYSKMDCEVSRQCSMDPLVGELYERTSSLLGMHVSNFESLEFQEYTVDQAHTGPHRDAKQFGSNHWDKVNVGPRVLTVFFYLSDVDEGGETAFPDLGVNVTPRKGMATVWSNVEEGDWWEAEDTSRHEGMPIKKGVKITANMVVRAFTYADIRLTGLYTGKKCKSSE